MPNGGSDCCGTCWFNQKNKGQPGYDHAKDAGDDYCVIRQTKIENPFWTYCTNHPHHNPEKIDLPIGPLYVCGKDSYGREIWQPSPDSEAIRLRLLSLLESVEEQPKAEYPAGVYLDEMVVWQLGEFREKRAVAGLVRIAGFNPAKSTGAPFNRTRERLVKLAQEATAKLNG
jgi:hypothetical protein